MSLTERRTTALSDDQQRADRQRDVEVDVELLVDRERERLRDALQRAGEHDRRAELAEPAREGERGARAETAAREREHHAQEHAAWPGAERPRRRRQRRIDDLEGRDRGTEVERARDEGHGEDHRDLRERDVDAEGVERPTEEPDAAEGDEQPESRRQRAAARAEARRASRATSRSAPRRVEIQYAAGVPKTRIASIETVIVSRGDPERVLRRLRTERRDELARAVPAGRPRRSGRSRKRRATLVARTSVARKRPSRTTPWAAGGSRSSLSAAWPFGESSVLIHACAAAFFVDFETTAIS